MSNKIELTYLAGGCFWCVDGVFRDLKGVLNIVVGYMGGTLENPSYDQVSTGKTGHYEVVKVEFDSEIISYKDILLLFFRNIDPFDADGQFVDRGSQYKTAVFCLNENQKIIAQSLIQELSQKFGKPVVTEVLEVKEFYVAEIYHQNYSVKNAAMYSLYNWRSGRKENLEKIWGNKLENSEIDLEDVAELKQDEIPDQVREDEKGDEVLRLALEDGKGEEQMIYSKIADEDLRTRLNDLQYQVTQLCGTEPPFANLYWNEKREGIYVDVVSGEVLFSSRDKFDSETGWPSFYKPIGDVLTEHEDRSLWHTVRTEVKSKLAGSHLGHVFDDGPKDFGGKRYCINSASLRFIPKEDLAKEGYGDWGDKC